MCSSGEASCSSDWSSGGFLAAVNASSLDTESASGCVCVLDDVEQTDETYEDVPSVDDTQGQGAGNEEQVCLRLWCFILC